MDTKVTKTIVFTFALLICLFVVWHAYTVFLLAFASILLAILLHAVGTWTQKVTRLPYPLALTTAAVCITAVVATVFWLYSPLIASQTMALIDQLPNASLTLRKNLAPYLGSELLSGDLVNRTFSFSNEKFVSQVLTLLSLTMTSIVGFTLFLIVGTYLALSPKRYVQWLLYVISKKKQARVLEILVKIGQSLRWWLVGKLLSMAVIGILSFVGLWLLDVSLAFILGLIAALLAFIPYVGAIIAAIPAILVAFTQSPALAFYVIILYLVIHLIEGYMITPYIEQRTVSIPPALTIMVQVLMLVLAGALGLGLATPLTVVAIALAHYSQHSSPEEDEAI